jgi:hypothetical protein
MRFNYNNIKIHSILSYLDACSSSDEEPDEDDVIMIRLLALVKRRRSPIVYRNRLICDVSPREAIADDELFDNPETREEANEPTAAGTRGVLPWFPAGVLIPCIVV